MQFGLDNNVSLLYKIVEFLFLSNMLQNLQNIAGKCLRIIKNVNELSIRLHNNRIGLTTSMKYF